ncbi:hypothetical protein [Mycobacterium sp. EPa45]|uniref:hypothetical protein n=1 Tax=Mycobacterium sp. EPa45 TaxID=1545728 RepID=UPI00064196A4|nr:hypothetical protein [Mycobacterium sp. EPa45]AKK25457.1 hypothetical protein AB431_00585 [Mycobacterium sp. EPa45]
MLMSLRSQKLLIWWTFVGAGVYGVVFFFLLHMFPPPSAQWSADQVREFYTQHNTSIRVGAVVMSWASAFVIPLAIVLALQMHRQERSAQPVWTVLGAAGGVMLSIFVVLPPIFWGVAAFKPDRPAEVTAVLHELGLLTFVTTDQYFVFLFVALTVLCMMPKPVEHWPFPRWFGYFTAWTALAIEAGAVAYLTRTGPMAWNGLLAFWLPTFAFFGWMVVAAVFLFKSLNAQIRDVLDHADGVRPEGNAVA